MVARWVARAPSDDDLACGLKLNLSSGMRSSDLRVLAISWSNSGSMDWLIFLLSCGKFCGCAAIVISLNNADQMIVLIARFNIVSGYKNSLLNISGVFLAFPYSSEHKKG